MTKEGSKKQFCLVRNKLISFIIFNLKEITLAAGKTALICGGAEGAGFK